MKSLILTITFTFLLLAPAAYSQGATIKNAAVLPLTSGSGIEKGEADAIADRFQTELLRLKLFKLIDRRQIDQILQEQGFQESGACTKSDCTVQIGQLLGADKIFTGSVSKVGSIFSLNIKQIDVSTGVIDAQYAIDSKGSIDKVLTESCASMASEFRKTSLDQEREIAGSSAGTQNPPPKMEGGKSSKTWLWIGGGILAAGGITAAILLAPSNTRKDTVTTTRGF